MQTKPWNATSYSKFYGMIWGPKLRLLPNQRLLHQETISIDYISAIDLNNDRSAPLTEQLAPATDRPAVPNEENIICVSID